MTNEWNISTTCYKTQYYLVWRYDFQTSFRYINLSQSVRYRWPIYRSFIEETSSLSKDRPCDCFGEKPISFAQVFYLPCTHERRRPRNDTGNSRAVFPTTFLANIYRKMEEVLFKFHQQSAPRNTENNFNDLSA